MSALIVKGGNPIKVTWTTTLWRRIDEETRHNYLESTNKETKTLEKVTTGKPVLIHRFKSKRAAHLLTEPPFTRGMCCESENLLSIATSFYVRPVGTWILSLDTYIIIFKSDECKDWNGKNLDDADILGLLTFYIISISYGGSVQQYIWFHKEIASMSILQAGVWLSQAEQTTINSMLSSKISVTCGIPPQVQSFNFMTPPTNLIFQH